MTTKKTAKANEAPRTAGLVQDSAQQIWLAGLGAFAKAQEEGTKAFQGLVKEGLSLQRQTKAAAEEKLAEASRKLSTLAEVTTGLTSGLTSGMGAGLSNLGVKAAQPWDKLESIFEERVAKALAQLGIPSAAELAALRAEVQALKQHVAALKPAGKAQAKTATKTKAKVAAKAPAKAPAKKVKVRARSRT